MAKRFLIPQMAATTRFILKFSRIWLALTGIGLAAFLTQLNQPTVAQNDPVKPTPKKKKVSAEPMLAALPLVGEVLALREENRQIDFPSAVRDKDGRTWIAYVEHDGNQDLVRLAKEAEVVATISESGIVHQPAIAIDAAGTPWVFWGQIGSDDVVQLLARKLGGEIEVVAKNTTGSNTFADAGTDSHGRIWVTWQSLRNGQSDVFARFLEDGKWSDEIEVATTNTGEWEPQIAFDLKGNAWITYDSSADNEFNIHLARVAIDGAVESWPIAHTARYEARADLATTRDGSGFWIAAERGRGRWGLDARGHGNDKGLNAQKNVLFGRFDIASETFTEHPLGPAGQAGSPVNLPTVGLDSAGRPWVAYRYFEKALWRIAATRFDPDSQTWTSPRRIPGSSFGQDRRSQFLAAMDGNLEFCWPSDRRKTKAAQKSGIYLATIDSNLEIPAVKPPPNSPKDPTREPFAASQSTPERPADDRHLWELDGKTYGLFWGDVHRHTDVSNCRTGFDGCIAEHFRYAYDIAKLDFMGTSDHTDIGKIYDPYEWWHNQRMHDALHAPKQFNSLYVYEREQRWPWGHRNIVFAQRGGPIVYINRTFYRNSQWQEAFPVKPGINQIHPTELWDILARYGKPVAAISHTGATGMGTDWGAYEEPIDLDTETIVEIYQGARVSYEGIGVPQPTAGLRPGERYTVVSGRNEPHEAPPAPITDFGKYNAGVYQNALKLGHRLGVFASSDHISQHVSYGVFCENFTRQGIIKGFQARRTMAATDKIYVNMTCNGKPMGSMIESKGHNPKIWFKIDGTADLKRVTVVRNELDWQILDEFDGSAFETRIVDDAPVEGESRYYLRVEQSDGNMAWTSPVWVR